MKRAHLIIISAGIAALAVCPVIADAATTAAKSPFSMIFGVGTMGISGGIQYRESPYFSTTAALGGLNVDPHFASGGESYNMSIHLLNGLVSEQWYPWQRGFYLSAGVLINGNSLSLKPSANVGGYYAMATPAKVTFSPIDPYLAIGYSQHFSRNSHWSFNVSAGAAYQGTPHVHVKMGAGPYAGMAQASEMASIKQSMSGFRFYPMVQTSVGYHW